MNLTRESGKLLRKLELTGHDRMHRAELRQHDAEFVVWYVDHDIAGNDEKVWKIFLAGTEARRYAK